MYAKPMLYIRAHIAYSSSVELILELRDYAFQDTCTDHLVFIEQALKDQEPGQPVSPQEYISYATKLSIWIGRGEMSQTRVADSLLSTRGRLEILSLQRCVIHQFSFILLVSVFTAIMPTTPPTPSGHHQTSQEPIKESNWSRNKLKSRIIWRKIES